MGDVLQSILRGRQTGQLAITLKGVGNHCKIFFSEGRINHMVCGRQLGAACLDTLIAGNISECFFIPDLKTSNIQTAGLETEQVIRELNERGVTVEVRAFLLDKSGASAAAIQNRAPIAAGATSDILRIQEGLKAALVDQLGPFGARIFTKVVEKKWGVMSPTKEDILKLVDLLKDEIEDEEGRREFLAEAVKYIR